MSVLASLRAAKQDRSRRLRAVAIGADLIPRSAHDDPHLQGIDLEARGHDHKTRRVGIDRLDMSPGDLSLELRAVAERIGAELQAAGSEEIGRWATDTVLAYARVKHLQQSTEVAMYYAWTRAAGAVWSGTNEQLTIHPDEREAAA
jgi:hypothetical protein